MHGNTARFLHSSPLWVCTPRSAGPPTSSPTASRCPRKADATIGDNWTEVLADRRVTFRLLAPNARTVSVFIGLKSAIDEPAGTTTTGMVKDTNGLWTATLGPFEPDLYAAGLRPFRYPVAGPLPLPRRLGHALFLGHRRTVAPNPGQPAGPRQRRADDCRTRY